MNKPSKPLNATKHEFNNEDPISGEPGAHPMGTGRQQATLVLDIRNSLRDYIRPMVMRFQVFWNVLPSGEI